MRHLRLDWQVLIVQELPLLTYLDMKHIHWLGIEWQLHDMDHSRTGDLVSWMQSDGQLLC